MTWTHDKLLDIYHSKGLRNMQAMIEPSRLGYEAHAKLYKNGRYVGTEVFGYFRTLGDAKRAVRDRMSVRKRYAKARRRYASR